LRYCPYCTKPLGFFAIVRQRFFAADNAELACDKCGSAISASGSAKLALLTGSGFCGYLWGQLVGGLLPSSWVTILSSILVAVVVAMVLAYYTAPLKSG